ncbi:hypothetical protein DV736_g5487, partial [Chaetothyriales sp. CBS 134916]
MVEAQGNKKKNLPDNTNLSTAARDEEDIVDWDGPDDPGNPVNWPHEKRWVHVILVAILGLIPNMATTMCAPAIEGIVADLGISSTAVSTLAITIYLVGLAFGPLFLSSTSELHGRLPVYHIANIVFMAFVVGNALSQTTAQFMVFRFFSGCAGGMPLALGGGTIADITAPAKRGLATALFSLGPLAGPVLGPVIGGFLQAAKGWRWTFWLLAILGGAAELTTVAVMRETSPKMILERKAARLRESTGNGSLRSTLESGLPLTIEQVIVQAVVRPSVLLGRSPVVLALSVYAALVFGVIYLLFTTFNDVFEGQYHFSKSVSGLAYLGLGIALVMSVCIFGKLNSRIQAAHLTADGGQKQSKPEYRLLPMIWFSPLVAVGLFIYGWTAYYKVHWIFPIIGTFIIGIGAYFVLEMPTQLYLIEMFGSKSAASALSANNLLRYMGGAFLPLAGPSLYRSLHYGWGNTLLGFLALIFVSAPILFYNYGEKLRTKDKVRR